MEFNEFSYEEKTKILVVGAGTAGLINAIILKKFLNFQIDIVKSDNIGIIGVGEGSTEHFKDFLDFAGIDHYSILKECGATYKSGIMFRGWGGEDYLHSVTYPFNFKFAQYKNVYARQIAFNHNYFQPKNIWENKINSWYLNKPEEMPFYQFHFDTYKLNNFLINFAKSIGINIYEDNILNINLNNNGEIDELIGEKNKYNYNFYIDATGFKRILISKLGGKWKSFKKYMKPNSAITFPTEELNEYNMWTIAQGMNNGWMFNLPVQGRCGNGYIYDNNYINEDQAINEVEQFFNKKIKFGKSFNFDPGAIDRAWIKNCVAVGLSSFFVEPLEASSIGTSIQQSFLLMHRISNYNKKSIDCYNKSFDDLTENIRDFIVLHYISNRKDTSFWLDLSAQKIPDSLQEKLKTWEHRLPINEDFSDLSDYILFKDSNFILVMEGMNLFNRDSIKKEFLNMSDSIINNANILVENQVKIDKTTKTLGHKEFIELIKNYC